MRILIVDDEQNARAALRGMINSNFTDIEIVDEVDSVPNAVKAIHKHNPDVVLLDIEMPGHLGIDILDFFDIKDVNFKIIFITAYNNYAIQAFEMAAVDYLLKPTRIDQLKRAFERIQTLTNEKNENYLVLKENLNEKKTNKIALATAEGLRIAKIEDIRYLKADGAYTHICFTNNDKITVSKNLHEYNSLEETGFFNRVNRSYIINIHYIEKIIKKQGGSIILDNGEEISVSIEKRKVLYQMFEDKTF